MNRKRTELTKERILQLREYGLLTKEIAVRFSVSEETVYDRLRPIPRSRARRLRVPA